MLAPAVLCSAFLLWLTADEIYFFWHMKIVDYFSEFDRILSLLLISLLSAAVGHRAMFIMQYSQMNLPLTTVFDANKMIFAIGLLENEKQVPFVLWFPASHNTSMRSTCPLSPFSCT
jgi:hypothetical protein